MLRNDLNWIAGGVIAAILVPVLSLMGVPFVISAIIAAIAFAGIVVLLAPRKLFEGIDIAAIGKDKIAFAQELLSEAGPAADRLSVAAAKIDNAATKSRVMHLAQISRDVFAKVEASPASASAVKRFLSYYLPRAAEIAEGYAVLEDKRAPDPAKLSEVKTVIERLEGAFVHYADSLADQELGSLDVDLRLVQASLKEDLGT